MSADDGSHAVPNALTRLVEAARSGLRRDVRALIDALPTARIMLPLMRSVAAAPVGQPVELNQTVDLSPHFVSDARDRKLLAVFSYFGPLDRIVPSLHWTTDGGPLQLFTMPGPAAFRLAYKVVDTWNVANLVIDPGAPSELVLTRDEVRSILDGNATPLEAYAASGRVEEPVHSGEALPTALLERVAACLSQYPEVRDHRLDRIFDPERDLRARLVLRVWASESVPRDAVIQAIGAAVQNDLPPPGELQIRFET